MFYTLIGLRFSWVDHGGDAFKFHHKYIVVVTGLVVMWSIPVYYPAYSGLTSSLAVRSGLSNALLQLVSYMWILPS